MTQRFRPLVLCYHAASETWQHALSLDAPTIERQVRALIRRRYRPARADDVVAGRGRLFHVTFDDAYTSVDRVLPALERLGVHASVYACPDFAGRALEVPELAAEPRDELQTMGWDELRALVERGVEVGSHTLSHPHLPRCGDDDLRRELVESKERLEDELRRPCRFLAYPFGDEDERVQRAAERAGYEAAFALPGRRSRPSPFALPRVGIYRGDNALKTLLKTSDLIRRPLEPLVGR